jgi:hypothetical protein
LFNEVFDFKPTKGVTGIRLRAPWGVWRNAGDVPLDYEPDQVMRAAATPSTFHVAILKSVFELNPARE